jgi:hypothetical protein
MFGALLVVAGPGAVLVGSRSACVSRLLAARRREVGTPRGSRRLTCLMQAVFVPAWFRDRPDVARLGRGFGISQATAYRYLAEAIEVIAQRAPSLEAALRSCRDQGMAYLILDGKVVAADRCEEKVTSKKGEEIDRWYSGKARRFGANVQGLFTPQGIPAWVSPGSPGGVHDITAARAHVLPGLRPWLKNLPVLADSGYEGAGCGIHVPVRKPPGGQELDIGNRSRNALLRSARCLGERGFALMTQRWRTLQHVMMSPSRIGDIAQAVLVLVQFEHKMITRTTS